MQMMVGLRDNIRVKIKINFDIPRISHLASLKFEFHVFISLV